MRGSLRVSLFLVLSLTGRLAAADWRLHVPRSTPVYSDPKLLLFSTHSTGALEAYNVSSQTMLWTQPAPCNVTDGSRKAYLFRRTGVSSIGFTCGSPLYGNNAMLTDLASLDDTTGHVATLQPFSVTETIGSTFTDPSSEAQADTVSGTYCVFLGQQPLCLLAATQAVWTPDFAVSRNSFPLYRSHLYRGTLVVVKDMTPYVFDARTGALRGIAGGVVTGSDVNVVAFHEDLTVLFQSDAFGTTASSAITVTVINNTDVTTLVENSPLQRGPSCRYKCEPLVFGGIDPLTLIVGFASALSSTSSSSAVEFMTWKVRLSPPLSVGAMAPLAYATTISTLPNVDFGCAETSGLVLCGSGQYSSAASSVLMHARTGVVVNTSSVGSLASVQSFVTVGTMLVAQGPSSAFETGSADSWWSAAYGRSSGGFLWLRALQSIDGSVAYDAVGSCAVLASPTGEVVCVGASG